MAKFGGPKKAAVLLMSLGATDAAALLRHMRRSEVEAITVEIANMRRVDRDVEIDILNEFYHLSQAQREMTQGGIDVARDMLIKAFDSHRADEIMRRLATLLQRRPFEALRKAEASQVLALVLNEHPQTIAVVLAHMDPAQASQVMAQLAPELQSAVTRRIALLGRVAPEVIKEVEALVERKLSQLSAQEVTKAGGINAIVPILNNTDRASERAILNGLEQYDPALAEEIRNRMFVFENLAEIDDRVVQKVLRRVDNKTLALALKGTASEVLDKVMRNLSQKAAAILKEDMDVLGAVRVRDVEQAQREIVNIIRQLEDQGEVVIARGGHDDFVV